MTGGGEREGTRNNMNYLSRQKCNKLTAGMSWDILLNRNMRPQSPLRDWAQSPWGRWGGRGREIISFPTEERVSFVYWSVSLGRFIGAAQYCIHIRCNSHNRTSTTSHILFTKRFEDFFFFTYQLICPAEDYNLEYNPTFWEFCTRLGHKDSKSKKHCP